MAGNTGSLTRTGYTFVGWNTQQSGSGTSYQADNDYTDDASVTLYAQWTANTYTVRFDANGGQGSMFDQTFTYDQAQALTKNSFTRSDGYAFGGWSAEKNGEGTSYTNGQSVKNLTAEAGGTGLTELVDFAFNRTDGNEGECTNLVEVKLPSTLTKIGKQAFNRCSGLKNVNIPDGVTSIGKAAFNRCSSLTSVVIPKSVTSIRHMTFAGCSSLVDLQVYSETPSTVESRAFEDVPQTARVTVPNGSGATYRNASGWSGFTIVERTN